MFLTENDLLVLILSGALIMCGTLVATSFFLRKEKIQVENRIDSKKEELIKEHGSLPEKVSKTDDLSDLAENLNVSGDTLEVPLKGANTLDVSNMGDLLCKADKACRSLLDFAQTLSSYQELNDQLLFYGVIPLTLIAVYSLGSNGAGAGSQGAGTDGRTEKRLQILEKKAKHQLNLDSRVEKLEGLYV